MPDNQLTVSWGWGPNQGLELAPVKSQTCGHVDSQLTVNTPELPVVGDQRLLGAWVGGSMKDFLCRGVKSHIAAIGDPGLDATP